ncbi:hypothetical protein HYDPIDRAFT_177273 [Hydnomerulius pinastri MD-312]|uniref:Uncharacterized protein n=1 Tax=Hydnomerulius pinastri MD-312 TaxID=994086 RepID=A0A0C9WBD6_9AGAM|nr:hypothetical protein HYDPIDRAFT_177273 [Hydnomerulius pinastri MD-312]
MSSCGKHLISQFADEPYINENSLFIDPKDGIIEQLAVPGIFSLRQLAMDDIKTEFHPSVNKPDIIKRFEEYGREQASLGTPLTVPWRPFHTQADFEFVELALEAALTSKQTSRLITLFHFCLRNPNSFLIELKFEVHCWPLWDWALDLVHDPNLASHFSLLPPGGKPFCIILYADKTRLSSFGSQTGHPVIARCANLPSHIRNGNGIGGGHVVGWLPKVKSNADQRDKGSKSDFAEFKRVVWHLAFKKLLESVELLSKTGCYYECADEILQLLIPLILILSADYEEQCFMALIQGPNGKCPCPICLVPEGKLLDLQTDYPLRTAADNAFFKVQHSDPYGAMSFDGLHAYQAGLGGKHLLEDFRSCIEAIGCYAVKEIDHLCSEFPRWPDFNHFDEVMRKTFNDGTKHQHIAKVTTQNILGDPEANPGGYLLMRCLRSFLILELYTSMEVHTSDTLAEGEAELLRFSKLMQVYFPKVHTHKHAFKDIMEKGTSRNYNTKPNEKMHGPLKKAYMLRTNFKNVSDQILNVDHLCWVSTFIRDQIDLLEASAANEDEELDDEDHPIHQCPNRGKAQSIPWKSGHISLGSPQKDKLSTNSAFHGFRRQFTHFLNDMSLVLNIPQPGGKLLKLNGDDELIEFHYLKVNYKSMVDWRQTTDWLRCSPMFHGHPQYDCLIIHTISEDISARLLFMFTFTIGGNTHPFALIRPYDAPITTTQWDSDFGVTRVKATSSSAVEFILLQSTIRGALLSPDSDRDGEFLVVDVIDADMLLRAKKMRD